MNKRLACEIAEELVYMMREIRDNPQDKLKGLDTIETKTEDSYLTRDIVNLLMEINDE